VIDQGSDGVDFAERLEELSEELEVLNAEGRELEERIARDRYRIAGHMRTVRLGEIASMHYGKLPPQEGVG